MTKKGNITRELSKKQAPETASVGNVSETKTQKKATGENRAILVIDDDPSNLDLMNDIFTDTKFTMLGARSPISGLELYRSHQSEIAMVILDYSMQEMDGKTAFEGLLKINSKVKVLVCSGYPEEQIAPAFGTLRPEGFFMKPYKPSALLARVEGMISDDLFGKTGR